METTDYITQEEVHRAQMELGILMREWLIEIFRKCSLIFLEATAISFAVFYFLYPTWSLSLLAIAALVFSVLIVGFGIAVLVIGTGKPLAARRSELRKLEKQLQAGEMILRPNPSMQSAGQERPTTD